MAKKILMPERIKKAKKKLTELSHEFVRRRDSIEDHTIAGNCFDCGKYGEGQNFQTGHWIPDSVGGATLRYHPHNMHGQYSGCNCGYQQEMVKIRYTQAMYQKYGEKRAMELVALKNRIIRADIIWYEKMIDLYTVGDENAIVEFLEGCA